MAFDFDERERAAFRGNLEAAVRAAYPDATVAWIGYRRLVVTWQGRQASIWEPNFFYSMPSYTEAEVIALALGHLDRTFNPQPEGA